MNRTTRDDYVRALLVSALAAQPAGDAPHIVDDDDLLVRWSANALSVAEQQLIAAHLGSCAECREILCDLVESQSIVLPPASMNRTQAEPHVELGLPIARSKRTLFWVSSCVAVAVVVVSIGIFRMSTDSFGNAIADLERRAASPSIEILTEAANLHANSTDPNYEPRLRSLIERTATMLVEQQFLSKDYAGALQVAELAASHNAATSRLLNFQLQAEQALMSENLLAMNVRLDRDHGYGLNGWNPAKLLIPKVPDAKSQSLLKEFISGVDKFPEAFDLRLSFARFLVSLKDWKGAEEQSRKALTLQPGSAVATELIGISLFEQQRFDLARLQFENAVSLDPHAETYKVNLAICLERLSKSEEARKIWDSLMNSTSDVTLRQAIEKLRR